MDDNLYTGIPQHVINFHQKDYALKHKLLELNSNDLECMQQNAGFALSSFPCPWAGQRSYSFL